MFPIELFDKIDEGVLQDSQSTATIGYTSYLTLNVPVDCFTKVSHRFLGALTPSLAEPFLAKLDVSKVGWICHNVVQKQTLLYGVN